MEFFEVTASSQNSVGEPPDLFPTAGRRTVRPIAWQILCIVIAIGLATSAATARGGWYDAGASCRRTITVGDEADRLAGPALAEVELYTDGHALPDFSDLRVTTDAGKLVPSHVLQAGPGDRVRIVFQVGQNQHNYFAYFGNPHPEPPAHEYADVPYHNGLLIETRVWTGGAVHTFEQIENSWDRSAPVLGRAIIDQPFLGYNLFGEQEQWISKITGELTVPRDGDYDIAMAVDDEGALYIDDKPILLAHLGGGDAKYHTSVNLGHGPHQFKLLHVNMANEGRFTVAWRPAGSGKYEVIPAGAFGLRIQAVAGEMEIHDKALTADFSPSDEAECFFADGYSMRYRFTASAKAGADTKVDWDFGDGQTGSGIEVDHVYLGAGIYPVKATLHHDGNVDTQTNRVVVERNYRHLLVAHEDPAPVQSKIAADYDLGKTRSADLNRIVLLHLEADKTGPAVAAAELLAAGKSFDDPAKVNATLLKLQQKLIDAGQPDQAIEVWDKVPVDSKLQPGAAANGAALALWWVGDVDKAVKLLTPFKDRNDPSLKRMYAESLVLSGRTDEGKKILASMESDLPPNRRSALSGASARTVEFFITEKDPDAGEAAWDKWQARFPTDFVEGYSVVLRTKLMTARKRPEAAAKIAEAFATAVPKSSYAPQLLDTAAKLMAKIDPAKSDSLRQTLKQKYPEDPLSQ